jgi:hypothetical protein
MIDNPRAESRASRAAEKHDLSRMISTHAAERTRLQAQLANVDSDQRRALLAQIVALVGEMDELQRQIRVLNGCKRCE